METFDDLQAAGIRPALVAALKRSYGQELLPLQRRVLAETGVLSQREDLLVVAPTASGKTLVAELACLAAAGRGRMGLYLVPTRALAEQKAREFAERYGPAGLRVACSTGDQRGDDAAILRRRVHLVVAVYEKAAALLAREPALLDFCGAMAADEVQILGDPERGGAVDLLLTRWRGAPAEARPQMVALSAVLGNAAELAAWLGVRLVQAATRCAPLREGVLDLSTGRFRGRDVVTCDRTEEALLEAGCDALEAVCALARERGPVLAFCPTRAAAENLALRAAEVMPLASGQPDDWEASLRRMPQGVARERLEELLPRGVGLHTADMTPALRRLVEDAFDAGAIRLLAATPTLEQGVNLSAATVVQSAEVMGESAFDGRPAPVPIPRSRLLNQGGRAGRTAAGEPGRSILLAAGPEEAEQLWKCHILAAPEPVRSPLLARPAAGALAALLRRGPAGREELRAMLAESFAATAAPDAAGPRVEADLRAGLEAYLWREDAPGRYALTALGEAVARTGIGAQTAADMHRLLEGATEAPARAAALLLAAMAPECEQDDLRVAAAERRHGTWPTGLLERLPERCGLSGRLRAHLRPKGGAPVACHRAARRALVLDDWLDGWPPEELELRHATTAGRLMRLAATASWLLAAAAEVAGAAECPPAVSDELMQVAEQLGRLAREEKPDAPREEAPAVEYESAAEPAELVAETAPDCAPAESGAVVDAEALERLVFSAEEPGVVEFAGARHELTPLQYRFLLTLARRAGATIGYREIHDAVWPDCQVEQQQIPYLRRVLNRRLRPGGTLIRTSHGWGLTLLLAPEQVALPPEETAEAANG